MVNLIIILFFGCGVWILGSMLLSVLKIAEGKEWFSMPLGLGVFAVLINILYFLLRLPMETIQKLLIACAILIFIFMLFQKRITQKMTTVLGYIIGTFLILSIPGLLGGKDFLVSGYGYWDDFNYMTSALIFRKFDYTYLCSHSLLELAAEGDILADLLFLGNLRPSVSLCFSALLDWGLGDLFTEAFFYCNMCLAIAVCPFAWLIEKLCAIIKTRAVTVTVYLFPIAYVIGFWGQLMFDIRVWSCLATLGILYCLAFWYLVDIDNFLRKDHLQSRQEYIFGVLMVAGAVIIYPEHSLYMAMALGLFTIIYILVNGRKCSLQKTGLLCVMLLVGGGLAVLPNCDAILGFAISQATTGITNPRIGWESVFLNYLQGLVVAPNNFLRIFHRIPSIIGLYFITPDYSCKKSVWMLQTVFTILFNIWIAGYSLYTIKKAWDRKKGDPVCLRILAILAIEAIPMIIFMLTGRIWSMGRAMQYSSGFLFVFLIAGLYQEKDQRHRWITDSFVFFYILSNILFFPCKSYEVLSDASRKLTNNYVSIYQRDDFIDWNLNVDELSGHQCMLIDIDQTVENHFYIWYIKQMLIYEQIDYTMHQPLAGMQTAELNNVMLFQKEYDGVISIAQDIDGKVRYEVKSMDTKK